MKSQIEILSDVVPSLGFAEFRVFPLPSEARVAELVSAKLIYLKIKCGQGFFI